MATLEAFRVAEIELIRRAQRDQLVTFEEGLSFDDRIEAASIIRIVGFLVTGVVWPVNAWRVAFFPYDPSERRQYALSALREHEA